MPVIVRCPDCDRSMNHLIDDSWSCPCGYRIDPPDKPGDEQKRRIEARETKSKNQSSLNRHLAQEGGETNG